MNHLATIRVSEPAGIERHGEAIRTGVPLERGGVSDVGALALFDARDLPLPAQFKSLATWPDGSIKWLLVDSRVSVNPRDELRLSLRKSAATAAADSIGVEPIADRLRIDTGAAIFEIPRAAGASFASVSVGGVACLDASGLVVKARGARNVPLSVRLTDARVEESGEVRAAVLCTGGIETRGREIARIALRLIFLQGSAALRVECEVWNPRAARHVGGLWDLGDAGSALLEDLSIELRPSRAAQHLTWQSESGEWRESPATAWSLYQDSSGGERWNSPNHLGGSGKLTVDFRGFRVRGANGAILHQGDRASPVVQVNGAGFGIAATVEHFWQNFPKALRWDGAALSVGLFPAESQAEFELQGGEKKRHAVLFEFGGDSPPRAMAALHAPLAVSLDPVESAATQAVGHLVPATADGNAGYLRYIASMLEGDQSVLAKREIIDEYGWRNFGDLYADHEAVNHQGSEPFISHYNNQYDFVYGAGMHFLRTGDRRWRELMIEAARHLIDIDIYHTREDKAEFNGGMFWHTDHHQPAATCTHRTYSRRNARGAYGGGPSNEHNYTSGLLQYYFLTGDPEAASAVLEIADWVIAMDDGGTTLLGVVDDGPTGLASKSRDMEYHKPGRGAGNSLNALLDAYAVSKRRHYLQFAETLIQRVIHPRDDVASLRLDQPEARWSYLVFLQALGKYLDHKRQWGETDYLFWYARAGLLAYADWMREHERPYGDLLHAVDLPTETWPAQDIRKCHVFHLAARYAPASQRARFSGLAASYFDRCLGDLLSFPTAFLTRPQVILAVYGVVHGYYQHEPRLEQIPDELPIDFGQPVEFVPQRARFARTLRNKLSVMVSEVRRIARDRVHGLLARLKI